MVRLRVNKERSITVDGVVCDGGLASALKIVLKMNGRGMIGRRHDHVRVRIVHDVVVELVPLEVDVGLELEGVPRSERVMHSFSCAMLMAAPMPWPMEKYHS